VGLAVTLIPPLISRLSGWHVPRMLELTFVFGMFLQYVSESLKLFEIFTYWDKLVHPAEILLATGVATFLLLGYREIHNLDIPDGLAAAGAMMFGVVLGASWELVEFAFDWFGNANLQKSNADTMTDILTNDAGAIFGALFALWLYRHHADDNQRVEFGKIADWLTDRLAQLRAQRGLGVRAKRSLVGAASQREGHRVGQGRQRRGDRRSLVGGELAQRRSNSRGGEQALLHQHRLHHRERRGGSGPGGRHAARQ